MSKVRESDNPYLGYLLLRDGHAVPLTGISPDEIKAGAKHRVPNPDADPLRHRQTLNAIVDRLGFCGDFGDFKISGWNSFNEFLRKNGCVRHVRLFPYDIGGSIDLFFGHRSITRCQPFSCCRRFFADGASVPFQPAQAPKILKLPIRPAARMCFRGLSSFR